jgi:hypothetical protein
MRFVSRPALLLALGLAAAGCGPSASDSVGGQAGPDPSSVRPDLPRVTLEVKGMT